MSERKLATTSLPLFAVLLGALAFNISSWPGEPRRSIQSSSLSSEIDKCGIDRQLEDGDSVLCNIHDEVATGDVNAKFVEREVRDRTKDDPMAKRKISEWKIDVCMRPTKAASDDGAGVVKGNPDCVSDVVKDDSQVASKIHEMTLKRKNEIEAQIEDGKEKQARLDACEEVNGKDISTNPIKVLECKAERLNKKSGEEQAEYFESEVQPALKDLASCLGNDDMVGMGGSLSTVSSVFRDASAGKDCAAQRAGAQALIKKLNRKYSRNKYMREALKDLSVFAAVSEEMNSLVDLNQLPANDPRRREAAQKAQYLQAAWDQYRNQRGGMFKSMRTPMAWQTFDVGSSLTSGMASYNAEMNMNFARINEVHRQYLAATGQLTEGQQVAGAATPVIAGSGRTARGQDSSQYQGAPVTSTGGANAPRVLQPQSANPANRPAGTANPAGGKPMLGQSAFGR